MAFTERYVRADADGTGNGTTDANNGVNGSFTWAQMLADATANSTTVPVRYNIKAGAYSRTTSADTFTTPGLTTSPRFIQGFNASAGDLEAQGRILGGTGVLDTTNFPVITYTTGNLTLPAYMVAEQLSVTSAKSGATVVDGVFDIVRRCLIVNTANNSGAIALTFGSGSTAVDCDIQAPGTTAGSQAVSLTLGYVTRCILTGSSGAGCVTLGARSAISFCQLRDAAFGVATAGTTSLAVVESCSYRNISGNYNNDATTGASPLTLVNNVAWGSAGASVWFNSTATIRGSYQQNNAVGNMGAADVNAGAWPVLGQVTLTADPFTSSTDFRLNSTPGGGVLCKGTGFWPYADIGAISVRALAANPLGGFVK
jgi:hypothetical protein